MSDERDELNQELQRKEKAFAKLLRGQNEMEKEDEELKKGVRRLSSSVQVQVIFQNMFDLGQVSASMCWVWGERLSTLGRR